MTENDVYQAAYRVAVAVFEHHADKRYAQPFALDKARQAAEAVVESVILKAVEQAQRDVPGEKELNPLSECRLCNGPAAMFWRFEKASAACESCRTWRRVTG